MQFPAAEQFAWQMQLPVTTDAVTCALYGYNKTVLDYPVAREQLRAAGVSFAAIDVCLDILEERFDMLHNQP